jgi:hypothetical protein
MIYQTLFFENGAEIGPKGNLWTGTHFILRSTIAIKNLPRDPICAITGWKEAIPASTLPVIEVPFFTNLNIQIHAAATILCQAPE